MTVPVAWRNLSHRKSRTAVAVLGVAFAIVLVFMQLAFHGASLASSVVMIDLFDYDIALIATDHAYIREPGHFQRSRIYQAAGVPGVLSAKPVRLAVFSWRVPATGFRYSTTVVGIEPGSNPFAVPEVALLCRRLHKQDAFLFDLKSKPFIGKPKVGDCVELGGCNLENVGCFDHGSGFATDCLTIVNDDTFMRLHPREHSPEHAELGLIRVQPGADPHAVLRALRNRLGDDVRVLTRGEFETKQQNYYVRSKPIGIMFEAGVFIGWAVGAAILHQVMANDVAGRIRQYASLKAVGWSNAAIMSIIFQQAFWLTVMGYIPATILSYFLYRLVGAKTNVTVELTPERVAAVGILVLAMCGFAAFLASRNLRKADPAELFA